MPPPARPEDLPPPDPDAGGQLEDLVAELNEAQQDRLLRAALAMTEAAIAPD